MRFFSKVVLVLLVLSVLTTPLFAETPAPTASRGFELTYAGEIPIPPADSRLLEVWIPLASAREGQSLSKRTIELSVPYKIHKDPVYQNEMIYFKQKNPASAPIPFKITYRAVVDKALYSAGQRGNHFEKYLKPSRLGIVNDKVKKIAEQEVPRQASILEKAKAIYNYVIEHMTYDKETPGWGNGDTERACILGKGNCTDFHSLFISVAHASDIPSRFKIGFEMPREPEGVIKGYHCWAEFYERDKGWQPVDASEAWKHPEKKDYYFANFDPNKFLISMGRDVELVPKQKGEPLNIFFYPYVEVDGKVLGGTKTEFHYKNNEQ